MSGSEMIEFLEATLEEMLARIPGSD